MIMSRELLTRTAEILSPLGHPKRLEILILLDRDPLSAGALAKHLDLEQSAMSHQLRLLRDAHLVVGSAKGGACSSTLPTTT